MTDHSGHRGRMRRRFLSGGLGGFDDLSLLELILSYAIPRQDTNPIAHRLLDRYGSLASVLEAEPGDLQKTEGVGEAAAVLLKLIPAAAKQYLSQRAETGKILNTTAKCADYLSPRFFGERSEVVWLLCLDGKMSVTDCRELVRGSVNSASVSVRRIIELGLASNACDSVLAHNHPGGLAIPSVEDERTTERIWSALAAMGVELSDHLIFAGTDCVSMADSGFFERLEARRRRLVP